MKPILIAASLMLVAGVANAQMGPPPGARMGGPMGGMMRGPRVDPDLNHDGKVTFDEFKAATAKRMLDRLDTDKDGRISKAEMQAMTDRMGGPPGGASRMGDRFVGEDADHDGYLSRAEIEAGAKPRFDAADTNHDGWLSKDELLTMRQNRRGPG